MDRMETPSLLLRKAFFADLNAIYKNVWSDEKLAEYMYWEPETSYQKAAERLQKTIIYQRENMAYFVCRKETDEVIGFAGLRKVNEQVYGESGICIASRWQNHGYGKEILEVLIKYAFEELLAVEFVYSYVRENERSRRLCMHWPFRYLSSSEEVRERDGKRLTIDSYVLGKEDYLYVQKEGAKQWKSKRKDWY